MKERKWKKQLCREKDKEKDKERKKERERRIRVESREQKCLYAHVQKKEQD